jgi:hypothetical protein
VLRTAAGPRVACRLPARCFGPARIGHSPGCGGGAADDVKRAFLAIGRRVARARSLGRQISEDDATALLLVATLLDLPFEDTDAATADAAARS